MVAVDGEKIVKIMMHFVLVIPVTILFLFDGGNWFRFLRRIIYWLYLIEHKEQDYVLKFSLLL